MKRENLANSMNKEITRLKYEDLMLGLKTTKEITSES